jgi:hypothetical protein
MSTSQARAERHRRIFWRRMLVHPGVALGLLAAFDEETVRLVLTRTE